MKEDARETSIRLDKAHCWHPFTRQSEWCADSHQPLMIEKGKGVWLQDMQGQSYIDGNASIWTNIHGHQHPHLNQAVEMQLSKIAHSSFLGFGHPLAGELAEKLCSFFPQSSLSRVFYSDNGSTAVECAMKMALQYRMQVGEPKRQSFVAFHQAYHGDTLGAASLGGVEMFFERFKKLGLKVHFVDSVEELKDLPEEVGIWTNGRDVCLSKRGCCTRFFMFSKRLNRWIHADGGYLGERGDLCGI